MKKLFNIKEEHMISLAKAKIPLESIYILGLIKAGKDVPEEMGKFQQYLVRKAYVDMKGVITEYGIKLYESLFKSPKTIIKTKKQVVKNDDFEKWWLCFPSTDHFTINGRTFQGTRSMKVGKEKCKQYFTVIINEGILGEDVIRSTEWLIKSAMEKSLRVGQNQVSYIPATERFLRERKFQPFIELSKKKREEIKASDTYI